MNKMMKLNSLFALILLSVFGTARIYSQAVPPFIENEQEAIEKAKPAAERTVYMPNLSYALISFDAVQVHNPLVSLTAFRFNPQERDTFFAASLFYSPQIMGEIRSDYPGLYHTAAALITGKIKRHTISAAFIARTDKPVYGGLNTVMGFAGYSNNLIKGEHFSMTLGLNLVVMDIGVKLDGDIPWLLWPIPSINLSWEYEWISISLTPAPHVVIAPQSPFCLTVKAKYPEYDISLWYRNFRNGNPSAEMFGMGIGIRNDTNKASFADGRSYGINYNALYGTIRLFRLLEISGGWVFNGKEGYGERSYEKLIGYGGLSVSEYEGNVGQGFYISVSARMMF
jgi:hypothetical protein